MSKMLIISTSYNVLQIILNGVEYISPNGCPQKKTAKLEAAIVCLKHLGLLPHMPNN